MIIYSGFVAYVLYRLFRYFSSAMCSCKNEMKDKVVIVTGANTGIGYETAMDLAGRGARVIIACRDLEKGAAARDRILVATGNYNVILKHLDLASFNSVRDFANDFLNSEDRLDVLVNNAGVGKLDNSFTEDMLPVEVQVNHFGPFLLTVLLLPALRKSAPSRVVVVSSIMHWFGKIDVKSMLKPAKNFLLHTRVYSNTKLANILFTNKLSRLLQGTGVTANCLHPGSVNTDMFRNKHFVIRYFIKMFFKTPLQGAQTSIHLSVAPELIHVTGQYFSECKVARCSKAAQDPRLADILWELSEYIVFNPPKDEE